MQREEILRKIREAGVVGAGGAGFPTYKKLDARVEHIIANGAECEPLLYKDRYTMLREGAYLFRGLQIMRELTGAQKVTIAIKEKNRDIAEIYAEKARNEGVDFFIYEDVYPAGDEYILVYEITGRRIPPGGIPLQVGAVVDNVETIVNIARAVDENQPVLDKFISVTGEVKEAVTLRVPVGTLFEDCLALAGGLTTDQPAYLTGGVMMGKVKESAQEGVSKTLGGLIILPRDHYLIRKKTIPRETYTRIGHGQCDQCSLCTEMCPRYILGYPIEPHKVMRNLLMTGEAKERASLWAQYCVECNVCTMIACPEGLDPMNICIDAKALLKEKGLSRTEDELEILFRDVHPARPGREIPITTVYRRLGLVPYDRQNTFREVDFSPRKVRLALNAHIGVPAQPLVRVGDRVKRGQKIADVPEGQLGAPVHASIEGRVTKIGGNDITIEQ